MLCQYKNIFGEPNKGVHKYRLFGIAIIDLLLTIILAFCISYFFSFNFFIVFFILMILAIILHKLFCVQTTIDKLLFS